MKNLLAKLKMPSAFTLLFGIIAIMAILTWIIPAGQYKMTAEETPIAGTYSGAEKSPQGLWDVVKAPIAGFVDAADVVMFVLVIGGFLAIQMKTGALDAGFGRLLRKLKGKEKWMIPILMTFFAIGGTTYGMQEETIAFYPLLIPLILAAGYNTLTVVLVIVLGSGVGVLGSTVNPFSTGIASGFADVSIGDGIVPRLAILVLSLLAAIWFVMRYAAKVKSGEIKESHDDAKSIDTSASKLAHDAEPPELSPKRKLILWVFGLTFLVMIIGVIPWAAKFNIMWFENAVKWLGELPVAGTILGNIVPPGDWWFAELAALFLFSAIIIAVIDRMGQAVFSETFVNGTKALLGVALIIAVARGITVIMNDGAISATIIHAGENLLNGMSQGVFGALSFIVYLPLSFIVPSTSGLATLSMPIMAPLADFAHVDRSVMVTAFQSAEGVINMIAPTVASLMGGLALAKVSYGLYVRRTWKFFILLSLISVGVITEVSM